MNLSDAGSASSPGCVLEDWTGKRRTRCDSRGAKMCARVASDKDIMIDTPTIWKQILDSENIAFTLRGS